MQPIIDPPKSVQPNKIKLFSILTRIIFNYLKFILIKTLILFLIWTFLIAPVFPLIPSISFGLAFIIVVFFEVFLITKISFEINELTNIIYNLTSWNSKSLSDTNLLLKKLNNVYNLILFKEISTEDELTKKETLDNESDSV